MHKGSSTPDTGLVGLVMLARYHGVAASAELLAHEFSAGRPFGTPEILQAAAKLGLKAKAVRCDRTRLERQPLPALAVDLEGRYLILARASDGKVLVQRPGEDRPATLEIGEFHSLWSGGLILIASRSSVATELARFDFTWFIPSLMRYRKLLGEVVIVSIALQLFGLATPLFFQVVTDKVLIHRGLTTLDVVAFGLLVVVCFDAALTTLRGYVFSHTTSRIDVELGSRLFRHLINLPMSYFGARRVGDSVARVRELENIRSFLTGNAITLVLDIAFSAIFIFIMLFYSVPLTLIVLASIPGYVLLSVIATPILRSRLNEKFARGAENQSFLVEAVSAIDTAKSMAVEPQFQRRWDNQLAGYVQASFKASTVSVLAGGGVSLIGKLVTVAVMWFGAREVIEGRLTVGQLIAFNMLANQVSAPIMRLAQLWTDFQQVGISVQRLGDILNTPTERAIAKSALPQIQGRIEFDDVTFRYRPDAREALRGVSLSVSPGEIIGIVGRSGSGKSTLTRLIQRMYLPERGRVMIDGFDIALADSSSLRRQIGVVLQENVLFNRTIRENIALTDPGAPVEQVIAAAKLAGAHEFILELPEGYDTLVGEHGSSLSGGQRQRIAIARALITNPRILIFDEATSALDYESERVIQQNMKSICAGRTVFIIAHRLSAVREATRIIVMDRGQIVEEGGHADLLTHQAGHYARLHRLQSA